VTQVLERLAYMSRRVRAAEERNAELDEIVRRFTGDQVEASRILTRLRALEQENRDLRRRLEEGRAGIERLLAKIRFLENHE
jgi:predicted nuclease with TOPRIM domain